MKAYLLTTGLLFAAVALAHVLRLFVEVDHTWATDREFYFENGGLALLCAAFAAWAFRLCFALARRGGSR